MTIRELKEVLSNNTAKKASELLGVSEDVCYKWRRQLEIAKPKIDLMGTFDKEYLKDVLSKNTIKESARILKINKSTALKWKRKMEI